MTRPNTDGGAAYIRARLEMVSRGITTAHGEESVFMKAIRGHQNDMWKELAIRSLRLYLIRPDAFESIGLTVETWYLNAVKPRDLWSSGVFPEMVRPGPSAPKEHALPVGAYMCLTSKGLDRYIEETGDKDPGKGLLTPEIAAYAKANGYVVTGSAPLLSDDLTYTEPIQVRWSEECVFWGGSSVVSQMLTLTELVLDEYGKSGDDILVESYLSRGGYYWVQATVIAACEWVASHGTHRAAKGTTFDIGALLKAYISRDTTYKMPHWLFDLRLGSKISGVSVTEFGGVVKGVDVFTYCQHELDESLLRLTKAAGDGYADDEKPYAPFIERRNECPLLTRSARCTSVLKRVCMSLALSFEHSDCEGLPSMDTYILEMGRYLGLKPGDRGKNASNAMMPITRLILASPKMVYGMPDIALSDEEVDLSHVGEAGGVMVTDEAARAMLCYTLTDPPRSDLGFDEIADLCFTEAGELSHVAELLWMTYATMAVGPRMPALMRAVTFWMNPASMAGIMRTTRATMTTESFISDKRKHLVEGVDSTAIPACAPQLAARWKVIFDRVMMSVPTRDGLRHNIARIITGASGGADKLKAETTLRQVVSDDGTYGIGKTEVEIRTAAKAAVIPCSASYMLSADYGSKIAGEITEKDPASIGSRCVAGRKMRPVYNVKASHQACLWNLSEAMGAIQRDESNREGNGNMRFAPEMRPGCPVRDWIRMISWTTAGTTRPDIVNLASDASSLDQFRATGERKVPLGLMDEICAAVTTDLLTETGMGMTYMGIIRELYRVRQGWPYLSAVTEAPGQIVMVSSMPSGDLVTTKENGNLTAAMHQYVSDVTGVDPVDMLIAGDDVCGHFVVDPDEVVGWVESREAAALKCGQKVKEFKSYSGSTLAHFLQIGISCGCAFSRRLAYDSEHARPTDVSSLSSELDRVVKACSRGGNAATSTLWMSMMFIMGSCQTVFGQSYTMGADTIVYTTGRSPVGFPSANERIWLSLHKVSLGIDQPYIRAPPKDDNTKVGARAVPDDMMVTVKVQGEKRNAESVLSLTDRATPVLIDSQRLADYHQLLVTSSGRALRAAINKESPQMLLENSVKYTAYGGIGAYLQNKTRFGATLNFMAAARNGNLPPNVRFSGQLAQAMHAHAPPRVVPSDYHEFVISSGGVRIKVELSLSQDAFFVFNEKTQNFEFHVYKGSNLVAQNIHPPRWHPFWASPPQLSTLASLCGVSATYETGRVDVMRRFQAPFRPDGLDSVAVVSTLFRLEPSLREDAAVLMGFKRTEYQKMAASIALLPILEKIQEAAEMSSTSDPLKSISYEMLGGKMETWGALPGDINLEDAFASDPDLATAFRTMVKNLFSQDVNFFTTFNQIEGDYKMVGRLPQYRTTLV